jgi:hypothetical protein
MDSMKLQFIYSYTGTENSDKTIWLQLVRYFEGRVPALYEWNNDLVSAALSLDITGLMNVLHIAHPGDNIQFKYVEYERLKDHRLQCFKTKVSLKTEVFSILDAPVSHGHTVTFIGLEGESDKIRSYKATLREPMQYILSVDKGHHKPKKPLKLTG